MLDPRPHLRRQRDARVGQQIEGGHRPTLSRGQGGHAGAPGEYDHAAGAGPDIARDGHRDDVAGGRIEAVEAGSAGAEQRAEAVGQLLGHRLGIERLGEAAAQRGEGLGLAPTILGLGDEARVPDRQRGLGREGQEEPLAILPERVNVAHVQGQHTRQLAALEDGRARERVEPLLDAPVGGVHARILRHIPDDDGVAVTCDPPGGALLEGELVRQVEPRDRGLHGPGLPDQPAAGEVGPPEHHAGRAR